MIFLIFFFFFLKTKKKRAKEIGEAWKDEKGCAASFYDMKKYAVVRVRKACFCEGTRPVLIFFEKEKPKARETHSEGHREGFFLSFKE